MKTLILPEQCRRLNSTLVSVYSASGIVPIDTRLHSTLENREAAEGSFVIYVMYQVCIAKPSLQVTFAGTKSSHLPFNQYDNKKN